MTPQTSQRVAADVALAEWDRVVVDTIADYGGWSIANDAAAQGLAASLKNKVELRPTLKGLEIETTSFVGRVVVGPLTITIRPKIDLVPLAQLLRYAYGLRDVETFDEAASATTQHGFQELLIHLLVTEVEELVQRGLARAYLPFADNLDRPRGRLDVAAIVRRSGIREARLPCKFYERHVDWQLNKVLLAGLKIAASLAVDRNLRHRVHRVAAAFDRVEAGTAVRVADIDKVARSLSRLTAAYRPALVLIRLLLEMSGVEMEGRSSLANVAGYLFDMNKFYQRLLSRFFRENLTDLRIQDEYSLNDIFAHASTTNLRRKRVPRPRPDFAAFHRKVLKGFLDAKYRDLWEKELPPEWLYQLSIYALASPSHQSVMLYATMSAEAQQERIEVRSPYLLNNNALASVVLRPVDLGRLAELTIPAKANKLREARQQYANELAASL